MLSAALSVSSDVDTYNAHLLRDDDIDPLNTGLVTCLYLFGRNEHGELSRGHKSNLPLPVKVATPHSLAQMAFGHEHAVALMMSHEVFTSGSWVAGKQGDSEVVSYVMLFCLSVCGSSEHVSEVVDEI